MADHGISITGFKRKRLDELLVEINDEMTTVFGSGLTLTPESVDGQITGIISESNANLWELAEEAYNAFNPSAAEGVILSNLVQLTGIRRLDAAPSNVTLVVGGVPGTLIPQGSLVTSTSSLAQFTTSTGVIIGPTLFSAVEAVAIVDGAITGPATTITQIDTPIVGWSTVNNPNDAILGRSIETDVELRSRQARSVAIKAQSSLDAIFASVSNLDGVIAVNAIENPTNVIDAEGLPPHSFRVVVTGGANSDIAQTIWEKKPAGILSFGTTTVIITDSQGLPHDISFSRPTEIPIFVTVNVTALAGFPVNGIALIQQAIIDYAMGTLTPDRDFALGDDIFASRLYTAVNSVPDHIVTSLLVGVTPVPLLDQVPIASDEIGTFDIINIAVNVV